MNLIVSGGLGVGKVKPSGASEGPRRPRAGVSGGGSQTIAGLTGRCQI